MIDPYKLLGVSEKSTDAEIKAAYRKLSKKHHPDLNPGNKEAENKFKEINNSYDMIKDKESRQKYNEQKEYEDYQKNQSTHSKRQGPFYNQTQTSQGRYNTNFSGHYEDLFSSIFGGRVPRDDFEMNRPAQDVHYELQITFDEAVLGIEKEIVLAKGKNLKVKIPPGIEDGTKLRFKGQGLSGTKKGSFGDAYVEIHVNQSKQFTRKGNDLYLDVPITLYEAILGGKIEVQTVGGKATLTIPPHSNTGTKLRMKNKGYRQKATDHHGDQFVELLIKLPEKQNHELTDFLTKWSSEHPYNPRK
ncbi:MAG: hypothetical protein A2Y40_01685 [Candidatus Margulisbacteria bacterium GWF2_35_9]|nr:MAG: hypothetical protein A2Y40_01685 [Candidatus Margulisbacteria bacterium GWF2_35_9]